LALSWIKMKDL